MKLFFDEVAANAGFDQDDIDRLVRARPLLEPHFPEVVESFYSVIRRSESMREIFEDDAQIERQKISLVGWLQDLFGGVYDEEYVERHAQIGRVHLRIGLDQRYMISMMSVIRGALGDVLAEVGSGWETAEHCATLKAVGRVLDLELAVMLETYHTLYEQRMRSNERLVTLGQFAASIGHDLRNPLAVIDSSAHLLLRRNLDERAEQHVTRIRQHAELCSKIVTGLMDLARERPLISARQPLADVVRNALNTLETEDALFLNLAEIQADVDETLIGQVVVNLVDNSIKVGASRVDVAVHESPEGEAIIEVSDNGPGIPVELLNRLFEPLVSGRSGGVGLGLALSERIVQEHGGSIAGENRKEGGARFVVRLPLTRRRRAP